MALLDGETLIAGGRFDAFKQARYAGWDGELGTMNHAEGIGRAEIADLAIARDLAPKHASGKQERPETLVNRVI